MELFSLRRMMVAGGGRIAGELEAIASKSKMKRYNRLPIKLKDA